MKKIFFVLILSFLALPSLLQAATLSLDSYNDEYYLGDSFLLNIFLDVDDECINTIEAKISFPRDILSFDGFISGDSLISVWIDNPTELDSEEINNSGEIYFAGGVPGGYCGKIPGDPGESNLIGKILFKIPSFYVGPEIKDILSIEFVGQPLALINDGLGTSDNLRLNNFEFRVEAKPSIMKQDASSIFKNDKIKPEPFVVELHQNDSMFSGKSFIIFSSIDKQTGVDHYEVLEYRDRKEAKTLTEKFLEYFNNYKTPVWLVAETPHVLEDQTLSSIIKVRAIDRAGNERLVEYIPPMKEQSSTPNHDYLIISAVVLLFIVVLLILFFCFRFFYKKLYNKKIKEEDFN